jgi:protein O-mannosyl-transferase
LASQSRDRGRRWTIGGGIVVALVTVLAFLPVLSAGFVTWDDDSNFLNNARYRGLGPAQLRWMWTTFHLGHYVPLSWMTLGLDYVVWGMNPAGYHLTSLALHTANAVAFYFVARRILRSSALADGASERNLAIVATFAALVFAIHPLRVESVAWITERRDVLSGLFSSLTLLAYLKSAGGESGRSWYWASVALFAAALLSKATTVTVPAILLILNVYPLARLGGPEGWTSSAAKRIYGELLPFVALSAAASAMAFVALQRVEQLPFAQKIAVSAYSLAFYLEKTAVPSSLAPLYKMPSRIDPAAGMYVGCYLLAIVLTGAAWLQRRRYRGVWLGWIAFIVVMLPMLGIHQNGPQIAADRYTYHASPIIALVAAGALAAALNPAGIASLVLSSTVVLALGTLTWRQSEIWHDSERMWSRVVEVDSTSSVAQTALANVLLRRSDYSGAIAHYQQSLAVNPASPEAHDNLGVALAHEGRYAEAAEQFQLTLRLRPNDYEAENDLGAALAATNDLTRAVEYYQRSLAINPDFADAQVNWGNALIRSGRLDDAIAHYQQAVKLKPDDSDAERNWGVALAQEGKMAAAADHFRRALDINPGDADAKEYLARAVAQLPGSPRKH